ncbi:hypothetical protein HCAG_02755 [Histoplasma mississippiense (nom. inval.)]|uniref:hypothetical protein n=1 Tax=Ajellomyces capsulatus (strain NAm1 / WU24) TaxID=2059318 RepID=UPI000157BD4F|nr:hypothetical protein HCAG_02755 [Histoplasma mississippiense (nom. inval.)]EDN06152.1 hypothetical protein HCAG_02755 [Histoplasma mississippiense (nom. inval.)]
MADPNNVSQYKYSAMSNLVLQADRRFVTRRTDEVTGDPESLAGRINIKDMGTRASGVDATKIKKAPVTPKNVERGAIREGEDVLRREQRKRKREEQTQLRGVGSKPDEAESKPKGGVQRGGLQPRKLINLDNLVFDQGNHLMTNPNVKLPQGSTKRTFKGYEEIHVPAPKPKKDPSERLIPISDLPDWARAGFRNSQKLNRIQTKCFPTAFNDDGNMLVCAPTGSGKTNVAMLTILREIGKNRNPETGEIMLDDFKIVYIAPLKALVQEQVGNFGERLKPYGIRVSELTGDRQLTKQQIADTQIIVTTPEKWDVITRKATDTSYTRLVRLIIIDEIHLLHDDRGPVLESIVSRTIRKIEQTGDPVRLIGLSATLPNYRDVGSFLRVDPINALFHFDGSYRPCPLKQEFIGVTDKKAIKQLKTMNDVCYTKVLEQVGTNKNQMLIFVHSRKETAKTARYIRDKAVEMETIGQILRSDAASQAILAEEADAVNDPALKDLMPYGFGIHHAGMSLADRTSVQELFADGSLQVLVCTATLAWGVNLPAHTVIIKGTQVYSPEKGSWVELSPQDVLQMLGRAGRPQYDTFGEGIIITSQTEMQYYLSLLNQQLPIESQLMSKLADNLNAEIVLGNVRNRDEGVDWLGYTYLFVRMLRSPGLYSVGTDYENDEALEQRRVDLIHSAATVLEKANLVKYDKKLGRLQSTEFGRIASHYYITHSSMIEFTVPITEPMPPNYFISLVSDRWMHSETKIPVSFQKLILPERFPAHTPLLDMQRVPVKALKRPEYQNLYPHWDHFNKVQTQTFKSLFDTDDNVFLGAPTGSGKTVCAEFALLHHWSKSTPGKAVYIAPFQELVDHRVTDWQTRLSNLNGGKAILKLTGETTADLKILEQADLVLGTPIQWDVLSRQWQRRRNVQAVELFIADELHMLGGQGGYIYEVVVSRMHYIALQTEKELRMIGLSVPLSNARDIGEWLGAKKHTIYNFSPHVRPVPLELHIQSYSIPHFPSLMLAMAKPAFTSILQLSPDKPTLVFVPTRKQTRSTALDLLAACIAADDEDRFLHADIGEISPLLKRIDEQALAESISHGIGYYHEALSNSDKRIVTHLFKLGAIQVMLASRDVCWEINFNAHLVIVMNTQFFDGREHRYIDYPISEILQMFGKASRPLEDSSGKGVLMVPAVKRDYYKKFLNEALPIESHLQIYLHDAFVAEISTRTIASTQDAVDWMTYTYFYRRLLANPSYYGLTDVSHEGLSTFLSELVESTLKELSEAKIIDLDEEDDTLSPLNAAMIAAYYNISFITMQTFLLSLSARTKLKGILEIVTSATEFETIQVRRHEEHILRRVYDRVPVKMSQPVYDSPHFKAFVLLQAHFSRMQLPIDLGKDQEMIVGKVLNLLSACAMWDRDSPLKQIPHFGPDTIKVANEFQIKDIFEFMEAMDPSENKDYASLVKRLGLDNKQLAQAAEFTNNKYPNMDLDFTVLDEENITAGEPAYIDIKIERDVEDDEEVDTTVSAPFYPGQKMENWWLVVGEEKTNSLLATKRITIRKKLQLKLEYIVPTPGEHELTLFLMSDSYVGVDQDPSFKITAAEGMDEDEEEEEDNEE